MNYKEFEIELNKFTKEELIEFIDNFDSYLAEYYKDHQGIKLVDECLPMNAPIYYEEYYLNKEVF